MSRSQRQEWDGRLGLQCPNWPALKEFMKINPQMCIQIHPLPDHGHHPNRSLQRPLSGDFCHVLAGLGVSTVPHCSQDQTPTRSRHTPLSPLQCMATSALSFSANPATLHSHAWLSSSCLISSCCPGHGAELSASYWSWNPLSAFAFQPLHLLCFCLEHPLSQKPQGRPFLNCGPQSTCYFLQDAASGPQAPSP